MPKYPCQGWINVIHTFLFLRRWRFRVELASDLVINSSWHGGLLSLHLFLQNAVSIFIHLEEPSGFNNNSRCLRFDNGWSFQLVARSKQVPVINRRLHE